jgi:hypothetical protein
MENARATLQPYELISTLHPMLGLADAESDGHSRKWDAKPSTKMARNNCTMLRPHHLIRCTDSDT